MKSWRLMVLLTSECLATVSSGAPLQTCWCEKFLFPFANCAWLSANKAGEMFLEINQKEKAAKCFLKAGNGVKAAKIYSEMLEEHSRDARDALVAVGAGNLIGFLVGLVPRALPDLVSYTFYRFECALRTAAVFGFIGIETIGYRIRLSSDEFHYREVWTYLYLLFALVALIEWWGASVRRRLQPG